MKINSASRIHALMSKWKSVTPSDPALKGWLWVLDLEKQNSTRDFMRVNQRLQLLFDELELLRDKLFLTNCAESIYQPPLSKLENALSPQLVTMNGEHVKQHLTEDVFTALAFCSALLPQEEDGIAADDFSALVGLINDLELLLQENSFPAPLAALIRRHIRLAELAIAQYPIRGATALKDAVKSAYGDLSFEGGVLASTTPENADAIRKLWTSMNKVADGAIKIYTLIQLGTDAAKFLGFDTDS